MLEDKSCGSLSLPSKFHRRITSVQGPSEIVERHLVSAEASLDTAERRNCHRVICETVWILRLIGFVPQYHELLEKFQMVLTFGSHHFWSLLNLLSNSRQAQSMDSLKEIELVGHYCWDSRAPP